MNEQLSVFQVCSDRKKQAIERYLRQGKKEPSISVNKYSPGQRATEYYRET